MLTTFLTEVGPHSEEAAHINPYIIGAVTLAFMLALLLGLLAFGKGREHT